MKSTQDGGWMTQNGRQTQKRLDLPEIWYLRVSGVAEFEYEVENSIFLDLDSPRNKVENTG